MQHDGRLRSSSLVRARHSRNIPKIVHEKKKTQPLFFFANPSLCMSTMHEISVYVSWGGCSSQVDTAEPFSAEHSQSIFLPTHPSHHRHLLLALSLPRRIISDHTSPLWVTSALKVKPCGCTSAKHKCLRWHFFFLGACGFVLTYQQTLMILIKKFKVLESLCALLKRHQCLGQFTQLGGNYACIDFVSLCKENCACRNKEKN